MNGKIRKLPSQERLKELFNYDPETGIFTRAIDRKRWKAGQIAGTEAGGYISINVDFVIFRAHRLAWMLMTGEDPGNNVDHKNGNGLDNRWENLRKCSVTQNLCNKRVQSNNKTGLKGVYFSKQHGKYIAKICVHRKSTHLGLYSTAQEAKAAYDAAAKVIHGDFWRS